MTCLGVLDRGEQGDYNETGLKEGGLIEMSTTVLHSRAAPSLCIYLPSALTSALVFKLNASEPLPGSLRQNDPMVSVAKRGKYSCNISSEP